MIRIIKEIAETVRLANEIAAQAGEGPRWTLFLTNRSFIVQIIALAFAMAAIFGLPIPLGAEDVSEIIAPLGMLVAQGWALAERLGGKTRVVWTRRQAQEARNEAYALSRALKDAGAL